MSDNEAAEQEAAERAARRQKAAEHRMIVQATLQAKRAGKLPVRKSSAASDAVTAIMVIGVVIGTLVLAMRYGN